MIVQTCRISQRNSHSPTFPPSHLPPSSRLPTPLTLSPLFSVLGGSPSPVIPAQAGIQNHLQPLNNPLPQLFQPA